MQNRWNDAEAAKFVQASQANGDPAALGERIYTSRLIGQDIDLVLHGGGNTSVKITAEDGTELIHIKGSGWDLDSIEAKGLPAVRQAALLAARDGGKLSDVAMVQLLRDNLIDPTSPTPSVEALLHAFLPFRFVDHTHATAILALADQPDMRETVARLYGSRVAYVPYVMPGFDLSIAADIIYRENPESEGLWLAQHGLFTYADTARGAYELMVEFVTIAEEELRRAGAILTGPQVSDAQIDPRLAEDISAALRAAGTPFTDGAALDFRSTPAIRTYVSRPDLAEIATRGTLTPDHVIRIKPFPMIIAPDASRADIDAALADYAQRYKAYFERNAPNASEPKTMLDALPRVVIIAGVGMVGLGANQKSASIAADLCEQSARAINAAETYGRFTPLNEPDLFDMEYWSLEQAKLSKP